MAFDAFPSPHFHCRVVYLSIIDDNLSCSLSKQIRLRFIRSGQICFGVVFFGPMWLVLNVKPGGHLFVTCTAHTQNICNNNNHNYENTLKSGVNGNSTEIISIYMKYIN